LQNILNDLLPRNRADFSQRNENFEEAIASCFFFDGYGLSKAEACSWLPSLARSSDLFSCSSLKKSEKS
jgi:hypothetical protein